LANFRTRPKKKCGKRNFCDNEIIKKVFLLCLSLSLACSPLQFGLGTKALVGENWRTISSIIDFYCSTGAIITTEGRIVSDNERSMSVLIELKNDPCRVDIWLVASGVAPFHSEAELSAFEKLPKTLGPK
jgi:hypothetical protein